MLFFLCHKNTNKLFRNTVNVKKHSPFDNAYNCCRQDMTASDDTNLKLLLRNTR